MSKASGGMLDRLMPSNGRTGLTHAELRKKRGGSRLEQSRASDDAPSHAKILDDRDTSK